MQLRHMNRNGYKLQKLLAQMNREEAKKELEQLRKLRSEQRNREKQLEKELKQETRLLRSYGKASYVNMSPCYSCCVKKFCSAVTPEHYTISERNCNKARKFIQEKLIEKYLEKICKEV